MASSCLFDLSSNVILIFLEHLCHLNITWFVTWSCWWRHNKVIKRSWIVSSDVPSVLKWGASVLNRATCLIVTYFYNILTKMTYWKMSYLYHWKWAIVAPSWCPQPRTVELEKFVGKSRSWNIQCGVGNASGKLYR